MNNLAEQLFEEMSESAKPVPETQYIDIPLVDMTIDELGDGALSALSYAIRQAQAERLAQLYNDAD